MIARDNGSSLANQPELVAHTLNKKHKHSHLLAASSILCHFTAYGHHVSQTLNTKKENARMCWDGTNKDHPDQWVMNDDVNMDDEPTITFGNSKDLFMEDMYHLRSKHGPKVPCYIATADIKACYRWPKLHPDICGAFSFHVGFLGLFCISAAMVFGFRGSSNAWEPIRRAIEVMTAVYFTKLASEVPSYDRFMDLITIATPSDDIERTPAFPCTTQTGTRDKPIQPRIYVDDAMICAVWHEMRFALRCLIHAIFVLCGFPDEARRQCSLALDKWTGLHVGEEAVLLGLIFSFRTLTVGITPEYLRELHQLLSSTWHHGRKSFTVNELEKLLGKCARLGEGANWVFHLLTQLYRSTWFALQQNTEFLGQRSPNFIQHMKRIKELRTNHQMDTRQRIAHINFAIKKSAQQVHKAKNQYFINKDMRAELDFLTAATAPDSEILWSTPIAHMIKRDPIGTPYSDACLTSGGGYCTSLRFIWYMTWPDEFVKRTLLHLKDNKDKNFISINIFEFASVIINYCAALTVVETTNFTADPWPVILAWCDNTSAVRWVTHACLTSDIGRALGRFFCALLINSRLGINAKWLSTTDNVIADTISRLKATMSSHSPHPSVDYCSLFQSFPQLKTCRTFLPSQELVSYLWHCLSTGSCPDLDRIKSLRRAGLGKLTTSDS